MTSHGTPLAEPLKTAGWAEQLLWLLGLRRRFVVSGGSMGPLLRSGDEVLINPRAGIREGDIVVAQHPFRGDVIWIKVVDHFDDKGRAHLLGTCPEQSTDSRTQGNVSKDRILGKVTSRLATP